MSVTFSRDEIDRDTISLADNDTTDDASGLDEDNEIRVYYTADLSLVAPSTTSITERRVDEERDDAIAGWKERYDGSSSYCSPHWRDQLDFKGWRGTLIHYTCLSSLGDTSDGNESYFTRVGDDERGVEEYKAERGLKQMGEYDDANAWDKAMRDAYWALQQFEDECADRVAEPIAIEDYVLVEDYQYGGQADLVYEDTNGETVLADIKTGSAVRMDNKLQVAAYAFAVPYDVDRAEIWRLYPDDKEVEIQSSEEWGRTLISLYEQFLGVLYRTLNELPDDDELRDILNASAIQTVDADTALEQNSSAAEL
jgi:hypothetical protein